MTAKEAYQKGYRVVAASEFEVGLTKNGRGIRTWFSKEFDRKIPSLDHPTIQHCIRLQEELENECSNMKHPPRKGDLPREELAKIAEEAIGPKGQWPGAEVLFKFTCEHCGERCTLQEPNKLYENGECFACGKETKIEFGGFTIHYIIGGKS